MKTISNILVTFIKKIMLFFIPKKYKKEKDIFHTTPILITIKNLTPYPIENLSIFKCKLSKNVVSITSTLFVNYNSNEIHLTKTKNVFSLLYMHFKCFKDSKTSFGISNIKHSDKFAVFYNNIKFLNPKSFNSQIVVLDKEIEVSEKMDLIIKELPENMEINFQFYPKPTRFKRFIYWLYRPISQSIYCQSL